MQGWYRTKVCTVLVKSFTGIKVGSNVAPLPFSDATAVYAWQINRGQGCVCTLRA